MIDLDHLKSLMPITITDLKNIVLEQIDMNKKYLRETWLRQCADIISDDKESIEKLTPSHDKVNINLNSLRLKVLELKFFLYLKFYINEKT